MNHQTTRLEYQRIRTIARQFRSMERMWAHKNALVPHDVAEFEARFTRIVDPHQYNRFLLMQQLKRRRFSVPTEWECIPF